MNDCTYTISIAESDKIAQYMLDVLHAYPGSPLTNIIVGSFGNEIRLMCDTRGLEKATISSPRFDSERTAVLDMFSQFLESAIWCSEHLLNPECLAIMPYAFLLKDDQHQFKFFYVPILNNSQHNTGIFSAPVCIESMSGLTLGEIFDNTDLVLLEQIDLRNPQKGLSILNSIIGRDSDQKNIKIGQNKLLYFVDKVKALSTKFIPGTNGTIILALATQLSMLAFAFTILSRGSSSTSPFLSFLITAVILLIIVLADIVLFFHKSSPLRHIFNTPSNQNRVNPPAIFDIKETITAKISGTGSHNRIAMICEGKPGTEAESTGRKSVILVDDFIIGRDSNKADMRIDTPSIGRMHARITRKQDSFFIEDLNSRNGTYVDHKRLNKNTEYPLPGKCKIRFADEEFYFITS